MKLNGVAHQNVTFDIAIGDPVTVVWDKELGEKLNDNVPAYRVMYEGQPLGWVPKVETVREWYMEAKAKNDRRKMRELTEVGNELVFIRDELYRDFHERHVLPTGKICGYTREGGVVRSVSVDLNYG